MEGQPQFSFFSSNLEENFKKGAQSCCWNAQQFLQRSLGHDCYSHMLFHAQIYKTQGSKLNY